MYTPQLSAPVPTYRSSRFAAGPAVVPSLCTSISVSIRDGKACLNLPVVGAVCIPVPDFVPNGTAVSAQACVCTRLGFIPCGVSVTLRALGQTIVSESFGCC